MSGRDMSLRPVKVPTFETDYRTIATAIPVPESLEALTAMREAEPRSLTGQPPIIWARGHDVNVFDPYGNKFIDWSSGVLIANAGHGNELVVEAIVDQAHARVLATYCFPSQPRIELVERLKEITPDGLDKVFLLSTGSETVEAAIKLARMYGARTRRTHVVSHRNAFHGRTLAAHLAGGALGGGGWEKGLDPYGHFVKVPYPAEPGRAPKSFRSFRQSLRAQILQPEEIAAVIAESFPGRNATLMPKGYVQDLRKWCSDNGVVLILDEVQAGFGRTGKLFGFEHYDIVPDLACFGKGISSSLPLSALIGRADIMDIPGIHAMSSTHGGSPIPCAAALANIDYLLEDNQAVIRNAAETGAYLGEQLRKIAEPYGGRVRIGGVGMVWAMQFYKENGHADPHKANRAWEEFVYGGNMFFAPVGEHGQTLKFCPPLTMTREAINDGLYGQQGIKEKLDRVMHE